MARLSIPACLFMGVLLAGAQTPDAGLDQKYLFIDAQTTRSRISRTVDFSRMRDRVMDAAARGYRVAFVAGSSFSANLLLERGALSPGNYRMVTSSRENAFLRDLNEAASLGFRVVPNHIKAFEERGTFGNRTTWFAVMLKQSDAPGVRYFVVKGTKQGEEALASQTPGGRALVGVVGRQGLVAANTLLFFEERSGKASAVAEPKQYRIVATSRTSAMQKDLMEAAEEGFRVIGAGFGYMTVLMMRDPGAEPTPVEYRVIAAVRAETALEELQTAGAEGFRVAVISENGQEGVFVLHRTPGSSRRFDYRQIELQEATANQTLVDAEADGYRIVCLLGDLVVLERARDGS